MDDVGQQLSDDSAGRASFSGTADSPQYNGDRFDARADSHWQTYFAIVAETIVAEVRPSTVMDVGCAVGMLVERLRELNVEAWGIDSSPRVISQVPPAMQPYCAVASATDELSGHFDLITCFGVLEHLAPSAAAAAVSNLCRHADAVLVSTTSDQVDDPMHLGAPGPDNWARLFFEQGFVRDFDHDACSYVSPHAVLFRKSDAEPADLVAGYEKTIWRTFRSLRDQRGRDHDEHGDLAKRIDADARLQEMLERQLSQAELRGAAETVAAVQRLEVVERTQLGLSRVLEEREAELRAARQEIEAIEATKIFRLSAPLRALYGRLRTRQMTTGETPPVAIVTELAPADATYDRWIAMYDNVGVERRRQIAAGLQQMTVQPLVSIIMPVYNPRPEFLHAAIESVRNQIYENWELCIADDASPDARIGRLLSEYAALDERIKVVTRSENGHISAASNDALRIARGQWVAGMDHDDQLAEVALALSMLAVRNRPEVGFIYSDEDKIDASGRRHSPHFKPEFDPVRLLGQNYLNHLSLLRRDLVVEAGGFREGFEGSQDWDLYLRVLEKLDPDHVVHVPHILYHWRAHDQSTATSLTAKPYAALAGQQAVVEHLERTGRAGSVSRNPTTGGLRVQWTLPGDAPHVSIIIPTRDGRHLARCMYSVLNLTHYPNFKVVVADNGSVDWETLSLLRSNASNVEVIRDEGVFNYSALNNRAVRECSGSVICLLNDDTEVTNGDWLHELVGQLSQPGVGAVGAKLIYPDRRIQHAGVILGMGGVAGHVHRLSDRVSVGYFGRLQLAQCFSAVTGACLVVRREAWEEVGGLDEEHLAVAFNDVDFCLRLGRAGWKITWTPEAELIHYESASRGVDTDGPDAQRFGAEISYMVSQWGELLRNDPAYNPNLTLASEDFSLAWPPRDDHLGLFETK